MRESMHPFFPKVSIGGMYVIEGNYRPYITECSPWLAGTRRVAMDR